MYPAGYIEREPSRELGPQTHSLCPWAQALSLRICLALGQSAARQPLGI